MGREPLHARRWLPMIALALAHAAQAQSVPSEKPPPCRAAEHRQFDFWLGHWDVFTPDGKLAGENLIERVLGGCALRETWSGRGGFAGTSLNSFDATDGQWHQSWFDNQGGRLQLAGGRSGEAMELSSTGPHPERPGSTLRQRIRWTPQGDGSVRQLWESSDDGGATWKVEFDGRYVRRR
jgi:hypothetical protein